MSFITPQTFGGNTYDAMANRLTINCDTWQLNTTSSLKWNHGEVVSRQWQAKSAFSDIMRDTPMQKTAQALCGKH
jgi:hypothetical protein